MFQVVFLLKFNSSGLFVSQRFFAFYFSPVPRVGKKKHTWMINFKLQTSDWLPAEKYFVCNQNMFHWEKILISVHVEAGGKILPTLWTANSPPYFLWLPDVFFTYLIDNAKKRGPLFSWDKKSLDLLFFSCLSCLSPKDISPHSIVLGIIIIFVPMLPHHLVRALGGGASLPPGCTSAKEGSERSKSLFVSKSTSLI